MKKNLIAAAVLGLAGPAMAQTSLTIYGVVDVGVTYGKGSLSDKTSVTSGNTGSSRIGFRGVEDLGGGYSAGFNLEAAVLADDGEGGTTNTNNQTTGAAAAGQAALGFGRRSTVSIYAPWGEVRAGRDYSTQYRNRADVDPFASAGVGAIQPFVGSLGGLVSTRASNFIGYYLNPGKVGGLYGQAQVYLGENPSGTPDSDSGSGKNLRIGYVYQDLNVAVSTAKTSYLATPTAGDITSDSAIALYGLGKVVLMAGWYRDSVARSTGTLVGRGWTAGGTWNVVGPHNFKFAVSKYGQNLGAAPSATKLSLGWEQVLSKRTLLYTYYGRVKNSGGATYGVGGSTTAANTTSSGFDIGIRHTF